MLMPDERLIEHLKQTYKGKSVNFEGELDCWQSRLMARISEQGNKVSFIEFALRRSLALGWSMAVVALIACSFDLAQQDDVASIFGITDESVVLTEFL